MSNIKDFITHIKKYGVARNNRFNIIINLPTKVQQKIGTTNTVQTSGVLNGISLTAQQVNLPGYNVSIQEAIHQNSTRKIVYDKSEGEFDITFLCSGNLLEKKLFDIWKKAIFNDDHTLEYYDEYIGIINIEQLNENDEVVYSCQVTECYPATVGALTLDRSSTNSQQTFNVVFNFRKVKPNNESEKLREVSVPVLKSNPVIVTTASSSASSTTLSGNDKFTTNYLNVVGTELSDTSTQNILKNTINAFGNEDTASFLEGLL